MQTHLQWRRQIRDGGEWDFTGSKRKCEGDGYPHVLHCGEGCTGVHTCQTYQIIPFNYVSFIIPPQSCFLKKSRDGINHGAPMFTFITTNAWQGHAFSRKKHWTDRTEQVWPPSTVVAWGNVQSLLNLNLRRKNLVQRQLSCLVCLLQPEERGAGSTGWILPYSQRWLSSCSPGRRVAVPPLRTWIQRGDFFPEVSLPGRDRAGGRQEPGQPAGPVWPAAPTLGSFQMPKCKSVSLKAKM